MARSSNDILFKFLGDTKSLDRATKNASRSMGKTETSSLSLKKAMGALGLAFGAKEILNFAGDAVQLAIAAEEVDSKFKAVFGSSEAFRKSLEEWGDVAGVTKTKTEDMAATFGNLAIAQGITEDETKALTLEVATLAGDMASFNDADPEQVFDDLNKALLTTEREGLKKYGIAISEAEVKTLAASIATADGRDEVTKADRAYASYKIAVQQAGKAVGDLARTSNSTANKQRQLTASMEEMKEELGAELLPVYQDLLRLSIELAPALGLVARAAGGATDSLGPFVSAVADAADSSQDAGERLGSLKDALFEWGHAIIDWSPPTFVFVKLLEKMKDESAGVKIGLDKATDGVKDLSAATAAIRRPYELFAAGMRDAAKATDTETAANQRNWSSVNSLNRLVGIFTGNLFDLAAARRATAVKQLFSGGGGQEFATGGVVQGPKGSPQMVLAHGGETVSTPGQASRSGGGGVTINVTALDPDAAAVAVADALRSYTDRYGPL